MNTKVIMLGTGTPNPIPHRSGPCVAVVVGESAYLVDIGANVSRQAQKAVLKGIEQLKVFNIKQAFITHLHSDHTLGLPDLILTPWVLNRNEPLEVYGPCGTKEMTDNILAAYKIDIESRINGHEKANKEGIKILSTEIEEGVVYKDSNVVVEAIRVNHPPFNAFAYKFTSSDRVVVISGDTAPCKNLIEKSKGCDVLVHEVFSSTGIKSRTAKWQNYHTSVHTSSIDLGNIAQEIMPKSLVLYHQLFMVNANGGGDKDSLILRENEMIDEIAKSYKGAIYSAKDLDIF